MNKMTEVDDVFYNIMQLLNEKDKMILCTVSSKFRQNILSAEYCPIYYKFTTSTFGPLIEDCNILNKLLLNANLTNNRFTIDMMVTWCGCCNSCQCCLACNACLLFKELTNLSHCLRSVCKFYNPTVRQYIDDIKKLKDIHKEECISNVDLFVK